MKAADKNHMSVLSNIFENADNIVIVPSYSLERNLTERLLKNSSNKAVLRPFFISYQDIAKNIYLFQSHIDTELNVEISAQTSRFLKRWNLMIAAFAENISVAAVQSLIKDIKSGKKYFASKKLITAVREYLDIDSNLRAIELLIHNLQKENNSAKLFVFSPISKGVIEDEISKMCAVCDNIEAVGDAAEVVKIKSDIRAINHKIFELTQKIQASEASNELEEAKIISLQIQEMLHENNSNIVVITNSYSLRRNVFLELESVDISTNYGVSIADTQEFQLLILMLLLLKDPHDTTVIIGILFSQLFKLNYEALNLDIYKHDLYIDENACVKNMIESNVSLKECHNAMSGVHQEKDLSKIFKKLHEVFFQYCDLSNMSWQIKNKLICFLDDLIKIAEVERIDIANQDLVAWLKFLAGSELIKYHANPTVVFYSLEDLDHMKVDRVIISDTDMIKAEHEAYDNESGNIACYRYLDVMQNSDVRITRASKVNGVIAEKSLMLKLLEQNNKVTYITKYHEIKKQIASFERMTPTQPKPMIEASDANTSYSVSAVDVLLRDPYSYYAKYILKLRKKDKFFDDVWAKDFGILTHDIISHMDFDKPLEELLLRCEASAESILSSQDKITKSYIKGRLNDFVKYIYQLLANHKYESRAEVNGAAVLKLENGQDVEIKSRADRILYNDETVEIIDFKTGVLPSEKQVNEGLYPQLPIEKLILEMEGFPMKTAGKDVRSSFILLKGADKNDNKSIKSDSEKADLSLKNLFAMFIAHNSPYFATYNEHDTKISDYSHLRRFQEWFDE